MSKNKVIIYTKDYCPYCERAKNLFEGKGISFEEVDLQDREDEFAQLKAKTGLMTVPQIFIGEHLVGGYSDLALIDKSGELDRLLAE